MGRIAQDSIAQRNALHDRLVTKNPCAAAILDIRNRLRNRHDVSHPASAIHSMIQKQIPSPARRRGKIAYLLLLGILPLELNGFYNAQLSQYPDWYWCVEILTWIVLPIFILFMAARWRLFHASEIGLHAEVAGHRSTGLLIAALLIVPAFFVIVDHVGYFAAQGFFPKNIGKIAFGYRDLVPSSGFLRALVLLHLCLTAGIVEEIYFRGMGRLLFPETSMGSAMYVIVSSLVFSSIHWEGGVWNLSATLVLGVTSSVLFVLLRNLWPLIVGHILCDFLWFR